MGSKADGEVENTFANAPSLPQTFLDQYCKRPCFHDEYLQTFNRPNVKLIDTKGKGVERITPKGVVANGKEYEVDCIIFSTGFVGCFHSV